MHLCPIVINLDRATDRLLTLATDLGAAGLSFERLPAVNGRDIPRRLASQFKDSHHLLDGEVGCYASHILAWEQIARSMEPWALVLEDDVRVPMDLSSRIEEIVARAPVGWDIIKLSSWAKHGEIVLTALSSGEKLVAYARVPVLMGASLVTKAGALKLCGHRSRNAPVDVDRAIH